MKRVAPTYHRVYLNNTEMIRVIIADDHTRIRQAWAFILSRYPGLQVLCQCTNGAEAIEAVKDYNPDIVLMDINMYPVNGIDATRAIVRNSPTTKVIGISVHADTFHVNRMMKAGASAYVTKNSSGEEMFTAIHHVMQGQRYICSEIEGMVRNQ